MRKAKISRLTHPLRIERGSQHLVSTSTATSGAKIRNDTKKNPSLPIASRTRKGLERSVETEKINQTRDFKAKTIADIARRDGVLITRMLEQLRYERSKKLAQGIPEKYLVYLAHNMTENTLGGWYKSYKECEDMITGIPRLINAGYSEFYLLDSNIHEIHAEDCRTSTYLRKIIKTWGKYAKQAMIELDTHIKTLV
jgi:hypothetical protein